jgi:hypothetical protein
MRIPITVKRNARVRAMAAASSRCARNGQFAVALVLGIAMAIAITHLKAQQAGPNVNVLPSFPLGNTSPPFPPPVIPDGTIDPLKGDGYLQRQVEPVVAASTLNPDHLMAAYGDFRTVDIGTDIGVPGAGSEGWLGYSRSYDRGKRWYGALVAGFPGGTAPADLNSPLHGMDAGSDPVLTTTPGGHFYLGGLFFDRGGLSNIAVVHLRDVPSLDGGDSIQPGKITIVDKGSHSDTGNFEDKPSIEGDIARGTTDPTICGPVYMAYTIFNGGTGGAFTSKVGFSRSKQGKCGEAWDNVQYLHKNYKQNQGTAMTVDPNSGKIYVVWRHFYVAGGDGFPDSLILATSTDYGASFSPPVTITGTDFAPYDQISISTANCTDPTKACPVTFRSHAFPTIAIDDGGNVYVAVQEKFPGSNGYYEPRVTIRTLKSGAKKWTSKSAIDFGPARGGQQLMPSLTFGGGLLSAMWYDFRGQGLPSSNVAGGWYISGLDRQMETRVAQSAFGAAGDANGNPTFTASVPVTKYLQDTHTGATPPLAPGSQLPAVNRGLPMYAKGTTAFTGDYITLMTGSPFAGPLRWATKPTDYAAKSSLAVWTDTRDVVFPGGNLFDVQGWRDYMPPGGGGASCMNPGSRNQNVYFSEVKPGVIAGSPATSRQLVDATGKAFERAFPFYVENPNPQKKFFRLTFQADSPGIAGSFVQGIGSNAIPPVVAVPSIDVPILGFSTVSKTLYAFCATCGNANAFAPFSLSVTEIKDDGTPVANPLTTLLRFNSDPTAPFVKNVNLGTQEIHDVNVSSPQYGDPQYGDPQYGDPQYGDPQYGDPQYGDPQYGDPQYGDSAPVGDFVWTATNVGNNSSSYNTIVNVSPLLVNASYKYKLIISRAYNTPGFNGCSSQPIPHDQVISIIPLSFSNPQYGDPQYGDPQYGDPQYADATFAAMPPSESAAGGALSAAALNATTASTTFSGSSGTAPIQSDRVFIVLRVYAPKGTPSLTLAQQAMFLASVSAAVTPQAGNSVAGGGITTFTPPTPKSNKAPTTTTLTSDTPSSVYGQPITFTAHVVGSPAVSGGTVTFRDVDGTGTLVRVLGTAAVNADGNAILAVSDLALGDHTVNAIFSGDATFNGSLSNSVPVTVTVAIADATLVDGIVGSPYPPSPQALSASGGTAPYTWAIDPNAQVYNASEQLVPATLPPGLSLDTQTGIISGTPTAVGEYAFRVIVTDAAGRTAAHNFCIHVDPNLPATLLTTDLTQGETAGNLASSLLDPDDAGVVVSNASSTGSAQAIGSFTGGGSATQGVGFDRGIILSSGAISGATGPNSTGSFQTLLGTPGDVDLQALAGATAVSFDAGILEFDFVPTCHGGATTCSVTFDYVFGSEEYPEFVGTVFNDVFGFFLRDVTAGGAKQNYAVLPGTATPVAINNVNGTTNSQYFRLNTGLNVQADGLTTPLQFSAAITSGHTYHIKIGITDIADRRYDSWVWIKSGSFKVTHICPIIVQ